jgi:hypothetical protein
MTHSLQVMTHGLQVMTHRLQVIPHKLQGNPRFRHPAPESCRGGEQGGIQYVSKQKLKVTVHHAGICLKQRNKDNFFFAKMFRIPDFFLKKFHAFPAEPFPGISERNAAGGSVPGAHSPPPDPALPPAGTPVPPVYHFLRRNSPAAVKKNSIMHGYFNRFFYFCNRYDGRNGTPSGEIK